MRPYVELEDVEFSYGKARVMPSGPTANRATSSQANPPPSRAGGHRLAESPRRSGQSPHPVPRHLRLIAQHRNLLLTGLTEAATYTRRPMIFRASFPAQSGRSYIGYRYFGVS